MPTLFLHAGQHKTGTTSLQKAFFDNRDALARQGLLYPRTGLPDKAATWGHHELAYALRRKAPAQRLWQALRAEADAARLPKVLISSEELSVLPAPTLPGGAPFRVIAQAFEGYDIRLICYLRPQAELILSTYNHHVKSVGEYGSVMEFIDRIAPQLDYEHFLHAASVGLNPGTVEVRRYQKAHMKSGDIIADMADRLGITLSRDMALGRPPLNSGLTREGLEKMLAANHRFADDPARLKAERDRIIKAHPAPAFHRSELLTDEMLQLIEALYRRKNRRIARRFMGLDEDLFAPFESGTGTGSAP